MDFDGGSDLVGELEDFLDTIPSTNNGHNNNNNNNNSAPVPVRPSQTPSIMTAATREQLRNHLGAEKRKFVEDSPSTGSPPAGIGPVAAVHGPQSVMHSVNNQPSTGAFDGLSAAKTQKLDPDGDPNDDLAELLNDSKPPVPQDDPQPTSTTTNTLLAQALRRGSNKGRPPQMEMSQSFPGSNANGGNFVTDDKQLMKKINTIMRNPGLDQRTKSEEFRKLLQEHPNGKAILQTLKKRGTTQRSKPQVNSGFEQNLPMMMQEEAPPQFNRTNSLMNEIDSLPANYDPPQMQATNGWSNNNMMQQQQQSKMQQQPMMVMRTQANVNVNGGNNYNNYYPTNASCMDSNGPYMESGWNNVNATGQQQYTPQPPPYPYTMPNRGGGAGRVRMPVMTANAYMHPNGPQQQQEFASAGPPMRVPFSMQQSHNRFNCNPNNPHMMSPGGFVRAGGVSNGGFVDSNVGSSMGYAPQQNDYGAIPSNRGMMHAQNQQQMMASSVAHGRMQRGGGTMPETMVKQQQQHLTNPGGNSTNGHNDFQQQQQFNNSNVMTGAPAQGPGEEASAPNWRSTPVGQQHRANIRQRLEETLKQMGDVPLSEAHCFEEEAFAQSDTQEQYSMRLGLWLASAFDRKKTTKMGKQPDPQHVDKSPGITNSVNSEEGMKKESSTDVLSSAPVSLSNDLKDCDAMAMQSSEQAATSVSGPNSPNNKRLSLSEKNPILTGLLPKSPKSEKAVMSVSPSSSPLGDSSSPPMGHLPQTATPASSASSSPGTAATPFATSGGGIISTMPTSKDSFHSPPTSSSFPIPSSFDESKSPLGNSTTTNAIQRGVRRSSGKNPQQQQQQQQVVTTNNPYSVDSGFGSPRSNTSTSLCSPKIQQGTSPSLMAVSESSSPEK